MKIRKIAVFLCLFLMISGCVSKSQHPVSTQIDPVAETVLPKQPTQTISKADILAQAVNNLQNASSFHLSSQSVRSYKTTSPDHSTQLIYGEDNRECQVIHYPQIKVTCSQSYRYSPEEPFSSTTIHYWQQDQNFFMQEETEDGLTQRAAIDESQIDPLSGDVYETLAAYYKEAKFIKQDNGIAEYELVHPAWYKLNSALGFANLGLFIGMQDNDQTVQQYLQDHYQYVNPPIFSIFVNLDTVQISKVSIDDRNFMTSIWASIDEELLKENRGTTELTKYEILESNASTYFFNNYDQVADFQIPQ